MGRIEILLTFPRRNWKSWFLFGYIDSCSSAGWFGIYVGWIEILILTRQIKVLSGFLFGLWHIYMSLEICSCYGLVQTSNKICQNIWLVFQWAWCPWKWEEFAWNMVVTKWLIIHLFLCIKICWLHIHLFIWTRPYTNNILYSPALFMDEVTVESIITIILITFQNWLDSVPRKTEQEGVNIVDRWDDQGYRCLAEQ